MRNAFAPVLVLASAILVAAPSAAQETKASLVGVMRHLFDESPTFRTYRVQTREAQAAHLATSGAFDFVAGTTVQAQRTLWAAPPYGALTDQGYNDVSVQASLATRARENVVIQLSGSRPLASSISSTLSPDQPQASVNVTIPLLRFGRSASYSAEERAAGLHASAMAALEQDAESDLAAIVAENYWRWVGAHEQLDLTRRLEAIARDQLRDVDTLIEQRARAAVDRLPFVAAAEGASASRTQAEQLMFDQQQIVWQTLGLPAPAAPIEPSTTLPEVPAPWLDGSHLARRAHELAAGRPFLAYLDRENDALAAHAERLRIAQRPDLNLLAQATATRAVSAGATTESAFGYFGLVALQFSFPIQNRAAQGAYHLAAELHSEQALAARRRRNEIGARIDALASALASLSRSYQQRARAAEQYQLAYEAERGKFRLGNATALDVVVAEQQSMNAEIAVVVERTAYALTLARLSHEAGVLTFAVTSRDAAALARVLTKSAL